MFKQFNPNPQGRSVGDCSVRAVSKALNQTWEKSLINMCVESLMCGDMPSANLVWGTYLKRNGFKRHSIEPTAIKDFVKTHSKGKYVVCTGSHVVCVEDGNYFDNWDSGNEIIIYYYVKE